MGELHEGAFDKRLLPFAALIGELCIEWTHLEGWIERLFMSVGEWDYTVRASMHMTRLLNQRDIIAAIKVGIAARGHPPTLCSAVIDSMDYIDSQLRPARNRCVHDIWVLAENLKDAMRLELKPRVQKIRGTNEFRVQTWTQTPVSTVEIKEIISDVVIEGAYIRKLLQFVSWNPALVQRHIGQLPERPQRPYLHRQQETQRQKDKTFVAPKPQRKSFRP